MRSCGILRRRRGVVIATRPGLNLLIADLAVPGLVTIGIEQMNLRSHARKLRKRMLKRYHKLDGLAVLTEQDREEYRAALNGRAPRMWRIPNTVSGIEPPQADPDRQAHLRRRPAHRAEGVRLPDPGLRARRRRASRLGAEDLRPR